MKVLNKIMAISSGRISLKYIAEFYNFNRYETKILIPYYLSNCILDTICKYVYPVTDTRIKHSVLFVYHQFGYRQVEEVFEYGRNKNLIIIEDCANMTPSNNVTGDVAFFSLSKFFNYNDGLIITANKEFQVMMMSKYNTLSNKILYNIVKYTRQYALESDMLTSMLYSIYQFIDYFPEVKISKLKLNSNILNVCKLLEIKTPPHRFVFDNTIQLNDKHHFEYYRFDKNRNMLNPSFELLPALSYDRLKEDQRLLDVVARNKSSFIVDGLTRI
jgi:hypothetical protein